ncbi:MAG: hypothetical protein ACKO9Q_08790, partial [Pirellula sp.]
TVLTADVIDEVEPVDWLTTLPLAVNVVNPVHVGSSRALADYRQRAVYLVRSIPRFNFNRRASESDLLNLSRCY